MALRSTARALARYDVQPHLVKHWKAYKPVNNQVVRQLSPYEQNVIKPFMAHLPAEMLDKAKGYLFEAGPAVFLGSALVYWTIKTDEDEIFSHRD